MRFSIGVGPVRFYSGGRRRKRQGEPDYFVLKVFGVALLTALGVIAVAILAVSALAWALGVIILGTGRWLVSLPQAGRKSYVQQLAPGFRAIRRAFIQPADPSADNKEQPVKPRAGRTVAAARSTTATVRAPGDVSPTSTMQLAATVPVTERPSFAVFERLTETLRAGESVEELVPTVVSLAALTERRLIVVLSSLACETFDYDSLSHIELVKAKGRFGTRLKALRITGDGRFAQFPIAASRAEQLKAALETRMGRVTSA